MEMSLWQNSFASKLRNSQ